MDNRLIELLESGLSPAEAVDYLATNDGHTQTEWAEIRGVGRKAVNKNVNQAKRKLADHESI